jgi:UDP-N-acetyl-2-amino-2-deoxyglucuronate dehydrogenase
MNFAIIGTAGYIAPRHLEAIQQTGNKVVVALDPNDSVGVLDRYFPDADFFTEFERFDRHLEKLRRKSDSERVHYVSICSPNYLHDAHVRAALRVNAHAICEKPLVINPWNLESLATIEQETGCKVFTVLQLRMNPALIALKQSFDTQRAGPNRPSRADIILTYITRRGKWYAVSWKGDPSKSGGLVTNIGIHLFDVVMWLFGGVQECQVHLNTQDRIAGTLELEWARVRWFLSTNAEDLPNGYINSGKYAYRSFTMNGEEIDLSDQFTNLHTRVYEDILGGGGFGMDVARPSIDLTYHIRNSSIVTSNSNAVHPLVLQF